MRTFDDENYCPFDDEDKIDQEEEIKETLLKIAKIMVKNKSLGLDVEFISKENNTHFIVSIDIKQPRMGRENKNYC